MTKLLDLIRTILAEAGFRITKAHNESMSNETRWPDNVTSKFYNKDYHYQMDKLKELEDDEK